MIYKWKDADGVIHFSDQSVPGAEKIYTGVASGPGAATPSRPTVALPASAPSPAAAAGLGYAEFSIASPQPDQTFFGDEVITVSVTLNPVLKANHSLNWHLNGKQIDEQGPNAIQFNLPHLDRGTYALAAIITDPQTGESRSTDSVTFFVRQPSMLSPQHQKP